MRKLDYITIDRRAGGSYRFQAYVWGYRFEPRPAAYVVAERRTIGSGTVTYKILYVGETGDLSTAFAAHEHLNVLEAHNANTIGVLPEPDPEARLRIVRELSRDIIFGSVRTHRSIATFLAR